MKQLRNQVLGPSISIFSKMINNEWTSLVSVSRSKNDLKILERFLRLIHIYTMVATHRERYPSHPNVDESLFGTRGQATHRSGSSRNAGKTIAAAHVLNKADLRRMKV